jgi:hypothetical protein
MRIGETRLEGMKDRLRGNGFLFSILYRSSVPPSLRPLFTRGARNEAELSQLKRRRSL